MFASQFFRSCSLFLLVAASAGAQVSLSLSEAVNQALSGHPLLQASSERIAASEGLRKQAGVLLNPRLVLQSENTPVNGPSSFRYWHDTDNFAYLTQTFETAGKRGLRVNLASAEVDRAELERDLARRHIAAQVKQAYWSAAVSQRIQEILAESLNNFQQIIEYHEARVREGAMAEVDLIRVRLEGERIALDANAAALEGDRARIALFREMGKTEFPLLHLTEPLDDANPAEIDVDAAKALENRVEVRLARLAVEQERRNLALQKATARPNVEVLFGYKRTIGWDSLVGGVQMDLPFSNRNQGNIAAAGAGIRLAESNLAATQAVVRAEVAAAQSDYEIRRRAVSRYLGTLRDSAAESQKIASAAYREGGTDLLRLLDAERVKLETDQLYFRTLGDYRKSIAALEAAMGAAQ